MIDFYKSRPIFNLRGGIGNQLFIYSAGNFLSSQIEVAPIFNPAGIDHGDCISELKIPGTFLNRAESKIANIERRLPETLTCRKNYDLTSPIGFSDNGFKVTKRSNISGYFQNSVFANFCLSRGDFNVLQTKPTRAQLREKHNDIAADGGTIVHLRFGDYLNASQSIGNLSLEYYRNVILSDKDISDNRIYVLSDDYSLAKQYFQELKGFDLSYLDNLKYDKDYELLSLFGAAKQIICANSTFSWWGAFLAPKSIKVYAPNPWFRSKLLQTQLNESFYPSYFKQYQSEWQG
jgi:hypothetical protein